ncbi:MAG: DUF1570 domain-containing protein [Planctomycetota bacterium]
MLCTAAASLAGCASTSPRTDDSTNTPALAAPVEFTVTDWTFADAVGSRIETPSYTIFTTDPNPVVERRLPAFLEDSLARYRSFAGAQLPTIQTQLTTYVMATRPQWAALVQREVSARNASVYLRIRRGGFAERGRAYFFDLGVQDTFATAAHEGWHQYTQATFRQPLPLWLEEGIAASMEGFRWNPQQPNRAVFLPWSNIERFDRLRDRVAATGPIPLRELLVSRPQDLIVSNQSGALDYYAHVWALAMFLQEAEGGRYRPGLAKLLEDAATGRLGVELASRFGRRAALSSVSRRLGPEAFLAYIDDDITRAEAAFEAFCRKVVAPGSKQRIAAGVSPL